ncbi:2434_t:CDS:1, partial [Dentiscutata heterogama]
NSRSVLVGGYTPVDWDTSGQYKYSTDSFVFSLNDPTNISNANLGRISSYANAIFCVDGYGPYFGDLYINEGYVYTDGNRYYNYVSFPNSQIEDYEVFQV